MSQTKRINLALQGGGAHGAFTWGVLDRLLEEPELEIAAISGTSAGALNGAALKAGLLSGGREAARENLEWVWNQMGALTDFPLENWVWGDLIEPGAVSRLVEMSPPYIAGEIAQRVFSPYAGGPLVRNPLERVIKKLKFEKVCAEGGPELFVSATNVRSGKIRVFSGKSISVKAILASTCLPTVFQAVEIQDDATGRTEAYWDGGYTGNPALFPLYAPGLPRDLVIVNINPIYRATLPITAQDIENRINEISFNAALLGELRSIAFVKRLLSEGKIEPGTMKDVLVHMIADDDLMTDLSVATKLVPTPFVMQKLRSAGRQAASSFLEKHWDAIGVAGTVDLQKTYR